MIDRLQAIALKIQPLRFMVIGIGLLCLVAMAFFILSPPSQGDRYLIPCIVGLFWSISTYYFIILFCSVPSKAAKSERRWERIKRGAWRGFYWLMALIFFGTTLAVAVVSYRLLSIWMRDYAG